MWVKWILGPNFADTAPELFAGQEMGEDALPILNNYGKFYGRITADVKAGLSQVRPAVA